MSEPSKRGGWTPERLPVRKYKKRSVSYGPMPEKYVSRKRGTCVRINLSLDVYLARALRELAKDAGPNMSAIVEDALRSWLKQKGYLL